MLAAKIFADCKTLDALIPLHSVVEGLHGECVEAR